MRRQAIVEIRHSGFERKIFEPTMDRWQAVTETIPGLLSFGEAFYNSFLIVIVSTVVVLVLAIPAAYALSIYPIGNWRDALFFFISTKFLPIVAAILPLWIIARELQLLNTHLVLIILYTAMNLPLAVWMLWSFFSEVPRELIEAAEIDGASIRSQITSVILPIEYPALSDNAGTYLKEAMGRKTLIGFGSSSMKASGTICRSMSSGCTPSTGSICTCIPPGSRLRHLNRP